MSTGSRTALDEAARGVLLLLVSLPGCLDWQTLQTGRCGDGFVGREERCDDGNQSPGDGCDERCEPELDAGWSLDAGSTPDAGEAGPAPALCGNGALEVGEECDDRNTVAGDGCSERCRDEPAKPLCSNGRPDPGEVCDDGNDSNADACLNGCSLATCGDGQVRAGVEECDVTSEMCTPACLLCGGPGSYFRPGTGHCFSVHTEPATYPAARAACQAEGGELWTVNTQNEGDDAVTRLGLAGRYWLGLQTSPMGNSWVTGEAVRFLYFAPDEPMPGMRCVSLVAGGANLWSSSACGTAQSFVCERSAPTIGPQNHAYKVHTGAVTRDTAIQLCSLEGSSLVALETDEERLLVGTLIDLRTWLDGSEPSEGTFVWPSGAPVDPTAFRAGQPDDQDGTQGCLTLDPQKRFSDERCDQLSAFVCEHS